MIGLHLTLALLGSFLAWVLLPEDRFRTTLVILPLVAGALATLERLTLRHGGRRIAGSARSLERVTLVLLLAAILCRDALGLRFSSVLVDGVLAAGLALLLGHRVLRLLIAWRPYLSRTPLSNVPYAFPALAFVVYLALCPWATQHRPPNGDEPYYLLITHSLAHDFDADLTNNYAAEDYRHYLDRKLEPQPGDPVGAGGELYSRHNLLLPLVLAPAYRLAGLAGALLVLCAMAALLTGQFLRLARNYFPTAQDGVLKAWTCFSFTAPVLLFSHQAWVEIPAALLLTWGLYHVLQLEKTDRIGGRHWLWIGVALVALPLLKFRFVLLSVPLAVLAIARADRRARRWALGASALLAVLTGLILLFNWRTFGNPLKYHPLQSLQIYLDGASRYVRGTLGLFFDTGFGWFAFAPVWALLLPALASAWRHHRTILLQVAFLCSLYWFALIPRGEWYGGWSPPFRYGVALLPVLALPLVPFLAKRFGTVQRTLWFTLVGLTAILTLVWVVLPGFTYNFGDGRSHLLDHWTIAVGDDVSRFFPSWTRARSANLWWPLATLVVLTLAFWRRPARARAQDSLWTASVLAGALLGTVIALPPWLARTLPTRVVELEDPYVRQEGGALHPPQWVSGRTRFRGSWSLAEANRLLVRLQPGGRGLDLELFLRNLQGLPGLTLHLSAGGQELGSVPVPTTAEWDEVHVDGLRWPGSASELEVTLRSTEPQPPAEMLLRIDRAVLDWKN